MTFSRAFVGILTTASLATGIMASPAAAAPTNAGGSFGPLDLVCGDQTDHYFFNGSDSVLHIVNGTSKFVAVSYGEGFYSYPGPDGTLITGSVPPTFKGESANGLKHLNDCTYRYSFTTTGGIASGYGTVRGFFTPSSN